MSVKEYQPDHNRQPEPTNWRVEAVPSSHFPLIQRFYQAHYKSARVKSHDLVWQLLLNNQRVAVMRLLPIGSDWLLSGLVVDSAMRRKGLAAHLLNQALTQYSSDCYLFCDASLTPLYRKSGFTGVNPDSLPTELRGRFHTYRRAQTSLVAMFRPTP
ncbi:GNAT family N-acetyltransferase [Paraferrimonas sedimenticola]|uniref:GNAT family N-acetyltransferase n=1 Tax=Paraferrimonas sedimenticola TaxID=375674 RepID=UPI0014735BC5|nr:GNAT family N-acetyltransferase [Paraferrimonas sedimenticola]